MPFLGTTQALRGLWNDILNVHVDLIVAFNVPLNNLTDTVQRTVIAIFRAEAQNCKLCT